MFADTYQAKYLSILYSIGSKPLQAWKSHVQNGRLQRVRDELICSSTVELTGNNVSTCYIECPQDSRAELGIKLPFLVLIIKNLNKIFSFEVEIMDHTGTKRRFRAGTYQSEMRKCHFMCAMALSLDEGWNQIQFNLADFTSRAYGTKFSHVTRIKINANCRIRRVYFSRRLYDDSELPADFRLYLPVKATGRSSTAALPGGSSNSDLPKTPKSRPPTVVPTIPGLNSPEPQDRKLSAKSSRAPSRNNSTSSRIKRVPSTSSRASVSRRSSQVSPSEFTTDEILQEPIKPISPEDEEISSELENNIQSTVEKMQELSEKDELAESDEFQEHIVTVDSINSVENDMEKIISSDINTEEFSNELNHIQSEIYSNITPSNITSSNITSSNIGEMDLDSDRYNGNSEFSNEFVESNTNGDIDSNSDNNQDNNIQYESDFTSVEADGVTGNNEPSSEEMNTIVYSQNEGRTEVYKSPNISADEMEDEDVNEYQENDSTGSPQRYPYFDKDAIKEERQKEMEDEKSSQSLADDEFDFSQRESKIAENDSDSKEEYSNEEVQENNRSAENEPELENPEIIEEISNDDNSFELGEENSTVDDTNSN